VGEEWGGNDERAGTLARFSRVVSVKVFPEEFLYCALQS
jgi:hypothetical protein